MTLKNNEEPKKYYIGMFVNTFSMIKIYKSIIFTVLYDRIFGAFLQFIKNLARKSTLIFWYIKAFVSIYII